MHSSARLRHVGGAVAIVVLLGSGLIALTQQSHASAHAPSQNETHTSVSERSIPVGALPASMTTVPMTYGSAARSYILERPPSITGPANLVVLLHGTGATAQEEMTRTGFGKLAVQQGFELVVPQSIGRTWNSGHGCCSYEAEQGIDDIGFVHAVIADVRARTAVNPDRIYLVGYSNGGKLAYGVACTKERVFAGLATYGAGPQLPCKDAAPLSLFVGYGTSDPLEPPTGMATNERGQHQPLTETVTQFLDRDHCVGRADTVTAASAKITTHGDCTNDTAVSVVEWSGQTHLFPHAPQVAAAADGASLMWQFLSRQDI